MPAAWQDLAKSILFQHLERGSGLASRGPAVVPRSGGARRSQGRRGPQAEGGRAAAGPQEGADGQEGAILVQKWCDRDPKRKVALKIENKRRFSGEDGSCLDAWLFVCRWKVERRRAA